MVVQCVRRVLVRRQEQGAGHCFGFVHLHLFKKKISYGLRVRHFSHGLGSGEARARLCVLQIVDVGHETLSGNLLPKPHAICVTLTKPAMQPECISH